MMAAPLRLSVLLLVSLLLLAVAHAYSVGAPSSVCALNAQLGCAFFFPSLSAAQRPLIVVPHRWLRFFPDMCEDGPNLPA